MPGPYGVTSTGFNRPTLQELIALFEADQHSEISPTLDVSTDSLVGQLNAIYARQLDIAWEGVETAYHGFDPDRAEAFLLVALAKLTGTEKRAASASQVELSCVLDAGTVLVAGTHFAHVIDQPDNRWTPREDFTAPSTGPHVVPFVAEQLGPTEAAAGTITVIATTVVGWSDPVTNPEPAIPGRVADDDATLRQRREDQLTRAGASTVDAIRADLLGFQDMESVTMFENVTDVTDVEGLPPHSFEAVIYDAGLLANDAIAQVIYDTKPAGIRAVGDASGTATDENGNTHSVPFTRVTELDVWIVFTIVQRDDYVGDAAFKATVADRLNELAIGQDVTPYDVTVATYGLGAQVNAVVFAFNPIPFLSVTLPVASRELARFASARISLIV